jgi:hypothetical protein
VLPHLISTAESGNLYTNQSPAHETKEEKIIDRIIDVITRQKHNPNSLFRGSPYGDLEKIAITQAKNSDLKVRDYILQWVNQWIKDYPDDCEFVEQIKRELEIDNNEAESIINQIKYDNNYEGTLETIKKSNFTVQNILLQRLERGDAGYSLFRASYNLFIRDLKQSIAVELQRQNNEIKYNEFKYPYMMDTN